jgi:integrase
VSNYSDGLLVPESRHIPAIKDLEDASKAPVQMHEVLAAILQAWRQETAYAKDEDFIFASAKAHGSQPRWHDRARLPAGSCSLRLGIIGKDCPRFGFHNFRYSLATFLVEDGTDPVVVQKMLRQSNLDTTMIYIHNAKRARVAQGQFMNRFMPSGVNSGVIKSETNGSD